MNDFKEQYENIIDEIEQLEFIYQFYENQENKKDCLLFLMDYFNSEKSTISEMKTILVITKNFEDKTVKGYRDDFLFEYNRKKANAVIEILKQQYLR
jgi:hypothetical protein